MITKTKNLLIVVGLQLVFLSNSIAQNCLNCTSVDSINLGLVACYPFSGNTNDETGVNGNGINNGAVLTTDRFGNANSAYLFTPNCSVSIPVTSLKLNMYTYSTWVKIAQLPASGALSSILSIGNNGATGDQSLNINHNYSSSNGFIIASYKSTSGADVAINGVLPVVDSWYHLVAVRDSIANKLKLYINGVKVAETTISTNAGYSTPVLGYIGARTPGNSGYFNGIIDDVRIYNRALSDTDVLILYNKVNIVNSDTTIAPGGSVQINYTGAASSYSWTPPAGVSDTSIPNPVLSPSVTTTYVLTTNGCTVSDSVTITVLSTGLTDIYGKLPVRIAPNPSSFGIFEFTTDKNINNNDLIVTVYNQLGQRIASEKYLVSQNRLDISGLGHGMYFVELSIRGTGEKATIKIVYR